MRSPLRRSRIPILFLVLLGLCAALPIVLLSFYWQHSTSIEQNEFLGGTSEVVKNFSARKSTDHLSSIEQEVNDEINEPDGVVYRDEGKTVDKGERNSSVNSTGLGLRNEVFTSPSKRSGGGTEVDDHNSTSTPGAMKQTPTTRLAMDETIRYMEDQVITAKAFLRFAPPSGNTHLVRELKLRIKDIERVLSQASKNSDLHRSVLQKMKAMENTLNKATKAYPDCSAIASKLLSMTRNIEEQLRAQKNQASYLTQLASRTLPKGLHCLSMRLTNEYFALSHEKRQLPNIHKFQKPDLYHYAIFSDNILACAVVVNSTISNSVEQEKIVFHIVTDSLNFPAMKLWFLMNPPGEATIQIQSLDEFEWLPSNYAVMIRQQGVSDQRYTSVLNHLRFYLPKIFPSLKRVLLLDHDVVVQKDLQMLWSVDMNGKVIGVVETCTNAYRLEKLANFNDPMISKNFDPEGCVWAFGMNMFDLQAWHRESLTKVYSKWLQLGKRKQLWKAGSLPLGQLVFYNHTFALDRQWHLLGLGDESALGKEDIERFAVIHYSGLRKPWLEMAVPKYRGYWNKYLNYEHPHLQQCNIHS